MKIVMINGQSHKGSTYNIGKILADKIGGEVEEFFLPRDFDKLCIGCTNCFTKGESFCPHFDILNPIIQAMDQADLLIFTSPVYVYHITGSMKNFLDHLGYRWMVHRPEERMFFKQAVCITTSAGAGTRYANKDLEHSLFFWGIPRIYKIGIAVHATSFDGVDSKRMAKIDKMTDKVARQVKKHYGNVKPRLKTKVMFNIMNKVVKGGWNDVDKNYRIEKGWDGVKRPWNQNGRDKE